MRLSAKDSSKPLAKTALVAVFTLEGKRPTLPAGVRVAASALAGFEGGFRSTRVADATAGPAPRVLLVGLGKPADVDAERVRRAAAVAAKHAESEGAETLALWCPAAVEKHFADLGELGCAVAEGAHLGVYRYDEFKSDAKPPKLKRATAWGSGADFRAGVRRGSVLAAANAYARDLQNAPANHMRPRDLVSRARRLARDHERITCKVLDEAAMKKLGMGSLLSVSRGSSEPAYLIHLTYKPKKRAKARLAFVGKGLTFDSGGISIKPSAKMDEMKYDMSGSAAVLGVFRALRELDVPYEVHGIVGTSENMPGGKATKPGDVVTAMDGTTIEVLNTDAEGRLVLADALCYTTKKVQPDTIIDLATLTGAVIVALGHELTGMFPSTDALRDALEEAGEATGERVWPLPLLDCHRDQMKGRVADLKNLNAEGNGSTAGAAFLAGFVGDVEWCHLDIAGTAWGSADRDYVGGPQGSGVGVRLLMQYMERRA